MRIHVCANLAPEGFAHKDFHLEHVRHVFISKNELQKLDQVTRKNKNNNNKNSTAIKTSIPEDQ